MSTLPQDAWEAEANRLLAEEAGLEQVVRDTETRYAGLRDVDAVLSLARVRLRYCIHALRGMPSRPGQPASDAERAALGRKGLSAVRLVEGLLTENVSEDQKGVIEATPLFAEVKGLLAEFVAAGGAAFLEARQLDRRRRHILSRGIAASLRKYLGEDDLYPPLALERLPGFARAALLFLFPSFLREHPEQPPYGIQEGSEVVYSSRAMKLPLSQAILYLEEELLPRLEARLASEPGTQALQAEIERVKERITQYGKLRFFPRSTPVLLEQGFYTDGMTSYTADGELLVPIPLAVSFRSGTNLDRKMELVRMDLVRRLAGRGVSREVDREYRRLRSLESGIRGSSRAASLKMDTAWGFRVLKTDFPFLARLADKQAFMELARMAAQGSLPDVEQRIESLLERDAEDALLRSPALPEPG